MASPSGPFHSGELIEDRYRVDGTIARGGMSIVYRGMDLRLDRPVAIKVMNSYMAANPKLLQRFIFEAKTIAALSDPGIVEVYDQGMYREQAFLVMELVQGGTLRELLTERGPMPPYAAVATIIPVLKALSKAHHNLLVHRDVKPENILISRTGDVKIADFGLVHSATAEESITTTLVGTTAYLSPEQVSGAPVNAPSDVYSIGILIYELLTGSVPFGSAMTIAVATRRLTEDVPPPSALVDDLPPEFDELVAMATARDPHRRFPDAGTMLRAVKAIADVLELPEYTIPVPSKAVERLNATALIARPQQQDVSSGNVATRISAGTPQKGNQTAVYSSYLEGKPPGVPNVPGSRAGADSPLSIQNNDLSVSQASENTRVTYLRRLPARSSVRRKAGRRIILIWLAVILIMTLILSLLGWKAGESWSSTLSAQNIQSVEHPLHHTKRDLR